MCNRLFIKRVSLVMLIAAALFALHVPLALAEGDSQDVAIEGVVDDSATTQAGFGDPNNDIITSMGVYEGELYAGTHNNAVDGRFVESVLTDVIEAPIVQLDGDGGTEVWATPDGTNWTQVNESNYGDVNDYGLNESTYGLVSFEGDLYAGTENYWEGGQVWQYDGTNWMNVVGPDGMLDSGFDDSDNTAIHSMVVFGNNLFAGTDNADDGTQIWSTGNGTTWFQENTDGFGDSDNTGTHAMVVFQNELYAATMNSDDGAQIWQADVVWQNMVGPDGTIGSGFGASDNIGIPSMIVFGNMLYAGTLNWDDGAEIWRTPDGINWFNVANDGFGDPDNVGVMSLGILGDFLYAGTFNTAAGSSQVWRSLDGTNWVLVNDDGFGDPANYAVYSMATFENGLYMGTANRLIDTAQIFRIQLEEEFLPFTPTSAEQGGVLPYTGGESIFSSAVPQTTTANTDWPLVAGMAALAGLILTLGGLVLVDSRVGKHRLQV